MTLDPGLERRLLGLLGLGVRGRGAVVGVQQTRDAALRGRLHFAVVAPDASRHSLEKIVPLLQARRIRFVHGPSSVALGAAVGREATAVVGIVDGQLARGMRELLEATPDGSRGSGSA
ncbi:MAG TPA: ribosomal L7Ae/L30e/S12e/Gadd45 family protein [Gemmatimonadaceae bacterium]|nr:ribosomal L7Ae/L30e/S12e/Gadd45 family protein [Gemmatimonadaceae bacterium]